MDTNIDMDHFTKTLVIKTGANEVYNGLTRSIRDWWSEMFEGSAQEIDHRFTISFGPQVFKTLLVKDLIRDKKVVWEVVDALIDLPELANKKEWVGTSIVWDIVSEEGRVPLHLTHIGLTPEVECYQVCTGGWESFLQSFDKFVTTGSGTPFRLKLL